ncbi:hypothetical protein IFM47457_08854 [Aspergillus lentulus]|nr:hypothetical protein IFM47457_08854 [Aspergillus lentulus]
MPLPGGRVTMDTVQANSSRRRQCKLRKSIITQLDKLVSTSRIAGKPLQLVKHGQPFQVIPQI